MTFEEFQNFPTAYEVFLNLKKSNANSILKSTEKGFDGEDFTFDTDIIRLYEYKDGITEYKTFIFPITRSQPRTYYENLVIWENAYGETTSWIFEYDLDENDLTKLSNDQKVDDLPKKFRVKLLNDPDDTYAIYIHDYGIWLRYDGRCFIYDRNGEIPTDCPEEVANLALTLSDPNNGGNGSGGSGAPYFNYIYIPPSLPGGNNGSSGPVGSYYPPAGVGGGPSVPTVVAPFVDLIEGIINNNFTEAEKLYLNSKPSLKDAVKDYLAEGNLINGPETIDLALEIVQFAMDNGTEDAIKLLEYLKDNSPVNEEVLDIAHLLLDTLEDEGEVDFNFIVIKDDSFANNPCLNNVYENLGGAPTFDNYLKAFDSDFSTADLILAAQPNLMTDDGPAYAITTAPLNNNMITIIFNTDYLSDPPLRVAGTFMHELIHATIFRWMLEAAETGALQPEEGMTQEELINYINNLRNDFPGIYDYYYQRRLPGWQHEQMAAHFMDIIIQAMKEYDSSQSEEVYEAIAWIGLKGTISWNNLTQEQRDNYNNIESNYLANNPSCQ
ncbi:hypothetical protein Q763_16630 [Flavobacterium beibuense F44-8]|uniref:Uncharacterized protein n=1 Tax=Flavobacterium beibuense F44-8 TaxID=1406840 RepID=A0A0A2LFB3_9FLAO|nr:hypothetical protein Q763_16630 [Flavobacterium beibuense F44-8]